MSFFMADSAISKQAEILREVKRLYENLHTHEDTAAIDLTTILPNTP